MDNAGLTTYLHRGKARVISTELIAILRTDCSRAPNCNA